MSTIVVVVIAAGITSPVTGVAIVLYLAAHPEKLDQWLALFFRSVSFIGQRFSMLRDKIERGRVASDIQALVNTAGRQITADCPNMLPHMVKVEWVKGSRAAVFLDQGEVIVRLDRQGNQERNIVVSTLVYLSKGLLPRARIYVDKVLLQAMDFAVARHIFHADRRTGSAEYFIREVFEPATQSTPRLRQDVGLLDDLEERGFLTRVFFNEVRELGDRLQPTAPNERIHSEVRTFTAFLHEIATKEWKEDVPLTFEGVRMKAHVLLVARQAVLEEYGLSAHKRRLERTVRSGIQAIYIAGWGAPNISSVRSLLDWVERDGLLTVLRTYHHNISVSPSGSPVRAILAVCTSNAEYLRNRQEVTQSVTATLAQHIPDVADGRWEVVGVERRPGLGCKVAIRVEDEYSGAAIRGLNARSPGLIERIRADLGGEPVFLIPWSADTANFISAALALATTDIRRIDLDEDNLSARVEVASDLVAKRAIGKAGWNVQTAGTLVGWEIRIESTSELLKGLSQEARQVWNVLNDSVREIREGAIKVDAIAREEGAGSKVVVKSVGDALDSAASQVCRERLSVARSGLRGEWVGFSDWSDEPRELIIGALYPLDSRDIVDIRLDEITFQAEVIVRDQQAAQRAIGSHGANVRLAQEVTNWLIKVRTETERVVELSTSPEQLMENALRRYIPEVDSGVVQVERVIYEPGVGAKVALIGPTDIIETCVRNKDERARAIQRDLAIPFITFVKWSDDAARNVIEALYPLAPEAVKKVELDEERRLIRLWISSVNARAYAIGARGKNVELAERLTGLAIFVEEYGEPVGA